MKSIIQPSAKNRIYGVLGLPFRSEVGLCGWISRYIVVRADVAEQS